MSRRTFLLLGLCFSIATRALGIWPMSRRDGKILSITKNCILEQKVAIENKKDENDHQNTKDKNDKYNEGVGLQIHRNEEEHRIKDRYDINKDSSDRLNEQKYNGDNNIYYANSVKKYNYGESLQTHSNEEGHNRLGHTDINSRSIDNKDGGSQGIYGDGYYVNSDRTNNKDGGPQDNYDRVNNQKYQGNDNSYFANSDRRYKEEEQEENRKYNHRDTNSGFMYNKDGSTQGLHDRPNQQNFHSFHNSDIYSGKKYDEDGSLEHKYFNRNNEGQHRNDHNRNYDHDRNTDIYDRTTSSRTYWGRHNDHKNDDCNSDSTSYETKINKGKFYKSRYNKARGCSSRRNSRKYSNYHTKKYKKSGYRSFYRSNNKYSRHRNYYGHNRYSTK